MILTASAESLSRPRPSEKLYPLRSVSVSCGRLRLVKPRRAFRISGTWRLFTLVLVREQLSHFGARAASGAAAGRGTAPPRWSPALIRGQSILHRPAKLEDGIQARDPETLAHVSLRPRHPQLAAALLHLIEAVDEPADARAVDALDPGHVEDDALQPLGKCAIQHRLDSLALRPAHHAAFERDHHRRGRDLFLIDFQCHGSAVPHQYMPDGSFCGGHPYTG